MGSSRKARGLTLCVRIQILQLHRQTTKTGTREWWYQTATLRTGNGVEAWLVVGRNAVWSGTWSVVCVCVCVCLTVCVERSAHSSPTSVGLSWTTSSSMSGPSMPLMHTLSLLVAGEAFFGELDGHGSCRSNK